MPIEKQKHQAEISIHLNLYPQIKCLKPDKKEVNNILKSTFFLTGKIIKQK